MSQQYLWCRAWPWFTPSFPVADFEILDGDDLEQQLVDLARAWDTAHPGELLESLVARAQVSRSQSLGLPMLPSGPSRVPLPKIPDASSAVPTFKKIGPLAGWTVEPRGVVEGSVIKTGPRPTAVVCFFKSGNVERAEGILEVLRDRVRASSVITVFGSAPVILRFGRIAASELAQSERVRIRLAIEEIQREGRAPNLWVRPFMVEAEKANAAFDAEEAEAENELPSLPASEAGVLFVLESARRKDSRGSTALKDIPALLKQNGWMTISISRIAKLIESARKRGFKIANNRDGNGYRLERPLGVMCETLGFAVPSPPTTRPRQDPDKSATN